MNVYKRKGVKVSIKKIEVIVSLSEKHNMSRIPKIELI